MANARYQEVIARILRHEGGFVDHPKDPGGATNLGITIATYRRYINPKGTVADLKKLTQAQAIKVYKAEYWDKVRGDDLPVGVDYAVADFGVNSGPSRGIKHLQRAVGVTEDGVIGPATMAAVKRVAPAVIVERITDSRMAFLRGLKTWDTFGKGWTSRVSSVRQAALADMNDNDTMRGVPVGSPKPDYVAKPVEHKTTTKSVVEQKPAQNAPQKPAAKPDPWLVALIRWLTGRG